MGIEPTEDGGFVILQGTMSLTKVDGDGVVLWNRSLERGTASAFAPTSDGGYIITGMIALCPSKAPAISLVKTDGAGTPQWTRTWVRTAAAGAVVELPGGEVP